MNNGQIEIGLYKGFGITALGYFPAEILFYTTYEYGKSRMKKAYKKLENYFPDTLPSSQTIGQIFDMRGNFSIQN